MFNCITSNPARYCHAKLLEWWQWYEPYYAFPIQVSHCSNSPLHLIVNFCLFIQVKLKMKSATVQRNIPSPAAFKEFLKSDDSLLSWNVSECETYCLANVMGVAIHQLTYNLAGVAGRPEQRCKWDMLEPHQVYFVKTYPWKLMYIVAISSLRCSFSYWKSFNSEEEHLKKTNIKDT